MWNTFLTDQSPRKGLGANRRNFKKYTRKSKWSCQIVGISKNTVFKTLLYFVPRSSILGDRTLVLHFIIYWKCFVKVLCYQKFSAVQSVNVYSTMIQGTISSKLQFVGDFNGLERKCLFLGTPDIWLLFLRFLNKR